MNKMLALALGVGAAAMISTTSAEARPTCYAGSATGGWGVGWGSNFYQARRLALYHCAINTPRGYTCYIRNCRY